MASAWLSYISYGISLICHILYLKNKDLKWSLNGKNSVIEYSDLSFIAYCLKHPYLEAMERCSNDIRNAFELLLFECDAEDMELLSYNRVLTRHLENFKLYSRYQRT